MVSNIFYFHPEPWGNVTNLTVAYFFQVGWLKLNHQPVEVGPQQLGGADSELCEFTVQLPLGRRMIFFRHAEHPGGWVFQVQAWGPEAL